MIAHIIPFSAEACGLGRDGQDRTGSPRVGPARVSCWRDGSVCLPVHAAGFEGLYCYPALDRPAVDAGGNALLKEIEALIGRFPPYSEAREQLSAALYSTSDILKVDGEGRVILTEPLKTHAGIKTTVVFAGHGHKFQIWEPGRFRAELAEATKKVRALKRRLGSRRAADDPHGARE
jgi:MraZ protein